jgi:hypothetical protein
MRKNLAKLGLLVAIVSMYSCGTSSDFSIFQRKYNPGYNFSLGKKTNAVLGNKAVSNTKVELAEEETPVMITPVAESLITESNDAVAATNNSENNTLINEVVSKEIQQQVVASSEKMSTPTKHSLVQKLAIKKAEKTIAKFEKKVLTEEISNETILLIILSLFPLLALIAMYLKDGKRITTNFWVDLILHLTVVGYAVFAVLVVLDVINLA